MSNHTNFLKQYQDKELVFALSLESGYWDDCCKDLQRGRLTFSRASAILNDAVAHEITTPKLAATMKVRFSLASVLNNPDVEIHDLRRDPPGCIPYVLICDALHANYDVTVDDSRVFTIHERS